MSLLMEANGAWVTSTVSSGNGNCVEVAVMPGGVLVRDSKDRTGPTLDFSPEEWVAFLAGARYGDFDLS